MKNCTSFCLLIVFLMLTCSLVASEQTVPEVTSPKLSEQSNPLVSGDIANIVPENNTLIQPLGTQISPPVVQQALTPDTLVAGSQKQTPPVPGGSELNPDLLNSTPSSLNMTGDPDLINDYPSITPPDSYTYYPGGPLWDGYNEKPSPKLVYDLNTRLLKTALATQGYSPQEIEQKSKALLPPPPSWLGGLPTKGVDQVPVILLNFPDQTQFPEQNPEDINLKFFGKGNSSFAPYESVSTYYRRSSEGLLDIQGDVADWVTSSKTRAEWRSLYANATTNKERGIVTSSLIKDALEKADAQLDFSKYDNDNDGYIDGIYIKYAGEPDGWNDLFWAFRWINFLDYQLDGKKVQWYVFSWYSSSTRDVDSYPYYSPHTDIHETGHLLGLPDYYDYDDTVGPKGGVGGWDMMDANFGDHNAFSKYLLNWTVPDLISTGQKTVMLPPISLGSKTVLIMPNVSLDTYTEFFMVNNKKGGVGNEPAIVPSKGYTLPYIPFNTTGLFIWHVDTTLNDEGSNYQYDNSYTSHKLLRLMEADGKEEIEKSSHGGYFDQADIYVPGTSIGPVTFPCTGNYAGNMTNVNIDNISVTGTGVSAQYQIFGQDTGYLSIKSTPSGATVSVDNEEKGITPLMVAGVKAGKHQVNVLKSGYSPASKMVSVIAGKTTPVAFNLSLVRGTGSIYVYSLPLGAEIWLDGVDTGYLTHYILRDVSPGDHTILLRKDGYNDYSKRVTVSPGRVAVIIGKLIPT